MLTRFAETNKQVIKWPHHQLVLANKAACTNAGGLMQSRESSNSAVLYRGGRRKQLVKSVHFDSPPLSPLYSSTLFFTPSLITLLDSRIIDFTSNLKRIIRHAVIVNGDRSCHFQTLRRISNGTLTFCSFNGLKYMPTHICNYIII